MNARKQKQIRELISKVLKQIGMFSQEAEDLIFGTGLIESNYDYLKQWNGGPAVTEETLSDLLETNIAYAIIMCRLKYRRVPKKLPKTVAGMGNYWKKYYNTDLGKGDPKEFVDKYKMTQ